MSATIPSKPWYDPEDTDDRNERVRIAYQSLYTITSFTEAEYSIRNETVEGRKGGIYLEGLYDGMLLYANSIHNSIRIGDDGLPIANQTMFGTNVMSSVYGLTYRGEKTHSTIVCLSCSSFLVHHTLILLSLLSIKYCCRSINLILCNFGYILYKQFYFVEFVIGS